MYRGMSLEQARAADTAHRKRLSVLAGLLLAQFVGMTANTIIITGLPIIVAEIGGTQSQYSWMLTSAILANCVMTPLAGKLSDLFDKKRVFLAGMIIFGLGSLLCGLAWDPQVLIFFRVLQGMGMGLQVTLTITILAAIIPPRDRGRYNGYQGAVMAVATVSGPLLGGIVVDTLGWRWCFWIAIPFVILASIIVAKRLNIDEPERPDPKLDVLGALLVAATAVTALLWVSNAGRTFPWVSLPSVAMVLGTVVAVAVFLLWERRHPEPLLPLDMLFNRTMVLGVIASVGVGVVLFGLMPFVGQYLQYGQGHSPTLAGLMTLPMMGGILIFSTWVGRFTSRHGRWKGTVVVGMGIMTAGLAAMVILKQNSPYWVLALGLFLAGTGLGMSMQNLMLGVQNLMPSRRMGAATATITFFRTLAGAVGVQVVGIIYGHAVNAEVIRTIGHVPEVPEGASGALDFAALPYRLEVLMREAYGDGIGWVFASVAVVGLIGWIAAMLMPPSDLRRTVDLEKA